MPQKRQQELPPLQAQQQPPRRELFTGKQPLYTLCQSPKSGGRLRLRQRAAPEALFTCSSSASISSRSSRFISANRHRCSNKPLCQPCRGHIKPLHHHRLPTDKCPACKSIRYINAPPAPVMWW